MNSIDLQFALLFARHRVIMSKERTVGHWLFIFLGIAAVMNENKFIQISCSRLSL